MEKFNWKRVGLVYNSDSAFTSETAVDFEQKIKSSKGKILVFSKEIRGTTKIYFDRVILHIKSQGVTILVVMLDRQQDSILVTRALKEGLLYPQYTWISHVETLPEWLVNKELHDRATIFNMVFKVILVSNDLLNDVIHSPSSLSSITTNTCELNRR